ncbi:hypothetical protein [Ferrimonas marina]|uniref:Uncharacterized protein n=1 Tax=Ferrimonas marina TaxID=299255 RepID=A0A1M5N535_9GAMM|nr:hypothetical protein [Ferrimonas marina]SHG84684.1 hypothetical protein SAMN02745129_0900 [Ferrimonas marina]
MSNSENDKMPESWYWMGAAMALGIVFMIAHKNGEWKRDELAKELGAIRYCTEVQTDDVRYSRMIGMLENAAYMQGEVNEDHVDAWIEHHRNESGLGPDSCALMLYDIFQG